MQIINIILYLIIIISVVIFVINTNKVNKPTKELINLVKPKNKIIYEEIISGGITNINYHCKITLDSIYIFNEHQKLINKPLDEQYKIILLELKNLDKNYLLTITSNEDHIGDYEILNHIIKINSIKIDYKKLDLMATTYEKYKNIKILIDKIKIYSMLIQH
jgi:hypothetical protein